MPYEEQRGTVLIPMHLYRFQEVQPKKSLSFYRDLTEQSGFELETAGVLKGGKSSGLWHVQDKVQP
jgi:hypothetical protein